MYDLLQTQFILGHEDLFHDFNGLILWDEFSNLEELL
jgi:hypothetical protein